MVRVKHDLTDKIFGRLRVLKQAEDYIEPKSGIHHAAWLCECSCENHTHIIVRGKDLLRDNGTKSCGCLAKELSKLREKEYNQYDLSGKYGIGWTNNTNEQFYFDLEDFDKIKNYCWYVHTNKDGYRSLQTNTYNEKENKRTTIKMHWLIVDKNYDHADRNPLNNRKSNLRPATVQENARNHNKQRNNTSGFTGVYWHKGDHIWVATIVINKKKMYIGSSVDKQKAVKMRLEAEAKYFGEFAPQRHLFEEYGIEYPKNN